MLRAHGASAQCSAHADECFHVSSTDELGDLWSRENGSSSPF